MFLVPPLPIDRLAQLPIVFHFLPFFHFGEDTVQLSRLLNDGASLIFVLSQVESSPSCSKFDQLACYDLIVAPTR